ncbi:MAG: endonuclease MutS2 [Bacillota bacterium]
MNGIITEREIKVLEFDQIRQRLASLTATPPARRQALDLLPSADVATVERLQRETDEGRLLGARGAFSPPAAADIEPYVLRADKGGVLSGAELAAVALFLKGVHRWRQFMKSEAQRDLYPLLAGLVAGLDGSPGLARDLERSIDPEGAVLDGASALLTALRRQQRVFQERIREKLDSYLRNTGFRRYLQEAIVTIRGGRFVLPVKQEYRHRVEGVLHDQSASGATLFIEPLPVVQLQNQLTVVTNQAEREIERIFSELSAAVAAARDQLLQDRALYTELDLIAARGRLSLEQKGVAPQIIREGKPRLHLAQARHPLLPGSVVPLNIRLGDDHRVLIITGPNTGGKTVALKTIGLLAVMAQSGLHIPAGDESALFIFECIRADIGDEQSIAQSLSTFSGHLKNIVSILAETGPSSLVLFDELGAGTDPSEGAALAMAVLAELSAAGTLTVATTHINELKLFAQVREGTQNAAMEFDQETLAPTYRLLQGVPGQSNAFVIAGKLGLPAAVLEQAKGFLRQEHGEMEEVIASLVEDQRRFSRDSRQAALERARAEAMLENLEREKEKFREQRDEIIRQAREEARYLVRRAKTTVDALIRELHQIRGAAGSEALARAEQLRGELHQLRREADQGSELEEQLPAPEPDLAPGKTVLVHSLKQKGEILSLTEDEALVQVGSIKVHVPRHDLRRWREQGPPGKPAAGGYTMQKAQAVRNEVDLRGLTVEEAIPAVEKLFDDAIWAGLSKVTLIHGKGTGKLKEGLRPFLQEHRLVKEFRAGLPNEGGGGVTIITL